MYSLLHFTKRLTSLGIVLVAVATVSAAALLVVIPQAATIVTANEGTAADIQLSPLAERSSMYAADGTFITNLSESNNNREEIALADIPQPVIDAVLAIEDADFYEHDGLNFRGTFRALVENVNAGGVAQGGSTITQQLVKKSLLTSAQNLNRKSTEAFYALRLERQMTKDEILERYLNTVYFGAGAYGIQAAAETYWGYDSASQLGWAEAAMLAGVIRSPISYDPTLNPGNAVERREVVVNRLIELEDLTPEEGEAILAAPLPAERQTPFDSAPTDYFYQEVLDILLNDPTVLGGDESQRYDAIYRGGLKIYTTFDATMQAQAEQARTDTLPNIKDDCYTRQRVDNDPAKECFPDFTIATVTVESHTGAVRALIGGPEFQREKFNVATQGARQPGSSMKTFVLAAAYEQGYTPADSIRQDHPCSFPNPGGYPDPYVVDAGGQAGGRGSLIQAVQVSSNCGFVRLGQIVGNQNVIDLATRLGISTQAMQPELSFPLGSYEVTPLEMAAAYAAFPNDGIYNEPYFIERIEDRNGEVIYQHAAEGARAMTSQTARLVSETLEANVTGGTGDAAAVPDHHIAGKTGTTQLHADAWFVGFSDYYTTAVWLGDPNERIRIEFPSWGERGWSATGRGGFGGDLPADFFGAYMGAVHAGLAPVEFPVPDPYSGGRQLRVPGEIEHCDYGAVAGGPTTLVESNGVQCYASVTTAPPDPGDGGGPGNNNGGNNDGGDNGGNNGGNNGGDGGRGGGEITTPGITTEPGD